MRKTSMALLAFAVLLALAVLLGCRRDGTETGAQRPGPEGGTESEAQKSRRSVLLTTRVHQCCLLA